MDVEGVRVGLLGEEAWLRVVGAIWKVENELDCKNGVL